MARTKTGSPLDEFEILEVAAPQFDGSEKVIPLYEAIPTRLAANNILRKMTGSDVPPATIHRWANKPGYPLGEKRYLRLPAARKAIRNPETGHSRARSVTTKEAIERFIARCKAEGSPVTKATSLKVDEIDE